MRQFISFKCRFPNALVKLLNSLLNSRLTSLFPAAVYFAYQGQKDLFTNLDFGIDMESRGIISQYLLNIPDLNTIDLAILNVCYRCVFVLQYASMR